jgi:hypothetical protein
VFRNEFFRKPPRQHKRRFENRRQSGVAKNRVIRKDASQKPPAAFETFGRASFVHDHERHDVEFVHALRAKGAGRDRYGLARFPNPGTCVCRLSARNYSITWPERLTLFFPKTATDLVVLMFAASIAALVSTVRPFPITTLRLRDCPYETDTFLIIVSGVLLPNRHSTDRKAAQVDARFFESVYPDVAGVGVFRFQTEVRDDFASPSGEPDQRQHLTHVAEHLPASHAPGVRSEPVFSVRRVYRGVYVDREFNSRRVPGANGKHAVGFTGDRRVRGVLAAFFRELRPGTSKGGSAKNRIRRFPRPRRDVFGTEKLAVAASNVECLEVVVKCTSIID